MDLNDRFLPVLREIDVLLAEAASLSASGPRFTIAHRFNHSANCLPGEEIAYVALMYRSREFILDLSTTEKLLFEALARTRHFPQNASQIAAYMRSDEFFARHGANGLGIRSKRTISCTAVKVYVQRLRLALRAVFETAGLRMDATRVLRTEETAGPIGYRFRASFEWRHLD